MNIDWSATGAWMQAWAGFAQAIAVLLAAILATNTFKSWRKQKLEERRIDAAERVLTLAYRVKHAFAAIRSPYKSAAAADEAMLHLLEGGLDLKKTPVRERNKIVEAQIVLDRINGYADLWNEFSSVIPIGSALLGTDVEKHLTVLWRQKRAVQVAAEQYPGADESDAEFSDEIATTLWESRASETSQKDLIRSALDQSVNGLEMLLLPIIRTETLG